MPRTDASIRPSTATTSSQIGAAETAARIIEELTYIRRGHAPRPALTAAISMREELTPFLLDELALAPVDVEARVSAEPDGDRFYYLHTIAMYLFAAWREPQAWPLILDYFCSDSDLADDLSGDDLGDDLPAILVRCYDGSDLSALERIIATTAYNRLFRYHCLRAYHGLTLTGAAPRGRLVRFVETLLDERATDDDGWYGWLALAAAEIREPRLAGKIEALFDAGLIDDRKYFAIVGRRDIARIMADRSDEIERDLLRNDRMNDVVDVICDWYALSTVRPQVDIASWLEHQVTRPVTYAGPKVGRNDACPCGSGKKYKKCCLQ